MDKEDLKEILIHINNEMVRFQEELEVEVAMVPTMDRHLILTLSSKHLIMVGIVSTILQLHKIL